MQSEKAAPIGSEKTYKEEGKMGNKYALNLSRMELEVLKKNLDERLKNEFVEYQAFENEEYWALVVMYKRILAMLGE